MKNRLSKETSPYLLQHAHNPVDWYPWGEEAFARARDEDKPMLVSIGYSACHWCHVMAHESFEDEETAAYMNRHFVNVKIDREERPDIDHIYMEAVQAITGSGGWPLNVFLNPDGKPFYGGTYFPPSPLPGRPSWRQVLEGMTDTFVNRRQEAEAQAENLTEHIARTGNMGTGAKKGNLKPLLEADAPVFTRAGMTKAAQALLNTADKQEGGFGSAPKFPQTFSIRFLLQHHYYSKEPGSLAQACLSLDKMLAGGLFDQLGGGFARYSTDRYWLAPHFEKMLYDNALLVTALAEAYQLTKEPRYADGIERTMTFVARELSNPEGGFYAALDADSEGEEGRYYVWSKAEVDGILDPVVSEEFSRYYDVSAAGNWEEKNILRRSDLDQPPLKILESARKKLFDEREKRVRPGLDDKSLTGWNALMITASCKAYAATGNPSYLGSAIKAIDFLYDRCRGSGIAYFYHTWKAAKPSVPAVLDDYAFIIEALIQLQEATGNTEYLHRARHCAEFVVENFSAEDGDYFYFTHKAQDDVILRKKDLFDGATPAGNSVMAMNLLILGIIFDVNQWRARAVSMTTGLASVITKYPGSFGNWATVANAIAYGLFEIVITGTQMKESYMQILTYFIPNRVLQSSSSPTNGFPLLDNKSISEKPLFFLCRDYSCQSPVTELRAFIPLLETV